MWVFINDRFVPEEEACISVFDQGLLYGDGVFETLLVHEGQLKFLDDHIIRLQESCRLIQLDLPHPEPPWKDLLQEFRRRNDLSKSLIRLTLTRGPSRRGPGVHDRTNPTLIIFSRDLPTLTSAQYQEGVPLIITDIQRQSPHALPPSIKSLNYLNNILAKREATGKQAFDGLMVNSHDHIAECTTSNIFFVRQNRLHTPSIACGILRGITRKIIMGLAADLNLPVEEGEYTREDLYQATECFLTNTGFGILPVRTIDRHVMGPYGTTSITYRLKQAYEDYLNKNL